MLDIHVLMESRRRDGRKESISPGSPWGLPPDADASPLLYPPSSSTDTKAASVCAKEQAP
ncbi:hypothetical protein LCGC14_2178480 [marine sediment metagenome]|uniref:Uncharacterized protein n=1 Tax=marine sediment metagenome TaxID=412755 RepID=A0A0F9G0I3_9ZZZZ